MAKINMTMKPDTNHIRHILKYRAERLINIAASLSEEGAPLSQEDNKLVRGILIEEGQSDLQYDLFCLAQGTANVDEVMERIGSWLQHCAG